MTSNVERENQHNTFKLEQIAAGESRHTQVFILVFTFANATNELTHTRTIHTHATSCEL